METLGAVLEMVQGQAVEPAWQCGRQARDSPSGAPPVCGDDHQARNADRITTRMGQFTFTPYAACRET